jgi:glycosyltransferase involved in cell wall biosynthesis
MHRAALRHPARFMSFLGACRRAVAAAVESERPAILHAHWWVPPGFAAAPIAARARIPLALSLHGTDVRLLAKLPTARFLARRVFRQAQAVLPVSTALRNEVDRMRLRGGPREVLPMPADAATFHPADGGARPDEGPAEFVLAARLTTQKRVDVAIRAMALVTDTTSPPILHVAGDGPERASLESYARSSGLGDRVVFHGMLAPCDLAALYRRARAVVLPSVGEGYGLTLVEGALCGAPPIGARSGGIAVRAGGRPGALPGALEAGRGCRVRPGVGGARPSSGGPGDTRAGRGPPPGPLRPSGGHLTGPSRVSRFEGRKLNSSSGRGESPHRW